MQKEVGNRRREEIPLSFKPIKRRSERELRPGPCKKTRPFPVFQHITSSVRYVDKQDRKGERRRRHTMCPCSSCNKLCAGRTGKIGRGRCKNSRPVPVFLNILALRIIGEHGQRCVFPPFYPLSPFLFLYLPLSLFGTVVFYIS